MIRNDEKVSRMQVVGQTGEELMESGGADLPDGSRDLGRVRGVQVA
jgi:hypothetical protein